jgi:hypothetical protein
MQNGKRILAVILMALAVLFAALSVGGIFGTWRVSNSLTDGIVGVLSRVDTALETTDNGLNTLNTRVANARVEVDAFEEAVLIAAEEFVDNPVIITTLSDRLDLGIAPAILKARDTVESVRETLVGIQNAVQAVNALPFVSLDPPEEGPLARLSEGIAALTEGVEAVRTGVREAKVEVAIQVVFRIGRATSRFDEGLGTIETAVTDLRGRVSELRSDVSRLKSRLVSWLDIAAVVITLILLWIIFSQVVLFVLGLSIYRQKDLFARWIGIAAQEGPAEQIEPEGAISGGE